MGSDPAKGIDTPVNINIRALGFVRSARTGPPIRKETPPLLPRRARDLT